MFKKTIYEYKNEYGEVTVSPYKPECEYELLYRLIAQDENYLLTDYNVYCTCIDVVERDIQLWHEVHKDDLDKSISQVEDLANKITDLEKFDTDIVSLTWDIDYRLYEVMWSLENTGLNFSDSIKDLSVSNKSDIASLSKYKQAKIIILGGIYNKDTLTRQLNTYLKRGIISQDEYDELSSLINAKELVECNIAQ